MMQTMDCSEARLSLGVYVLGAIDPAERALVDGHLATCRDCRDELAGLAGLPALLARVSKEEAIGLADDDFETPPLDEEPPRELLGTVIDLTAARRRRQRWRNVVMSAAAALVIAAGVFGGVSALNRPASSPQAGQQFETGTGGPWETASIVSPAGQGATVEYRQAGWGVQLATKVVGVPVGTTCGLWVVEKNGKRLLVGSWTTDTNENNVWYPSSAATSAANVQSFVITVGKKQSINVPASLPGPAVGPAKALTVGSFGNGTSGLRAEHVRDGRSDRAGGGARGGHGDRRGLPAQAGTASSGAEHASRAG